MTTIEAFRQDAWMRQDPRRPDDCATLTPKRHRDSALCKDYARRQALVEVDVLAAKAFGLALDEPQIICCLQFPVVRQYEAETCYNITGGIVPTPLKGLPGAGLPHGAVEGDTSYTLTTPEGTIARHVTDDSHLGGPAER